MAKRKRRIEEPELVRRDGALCCTLVNTATDRRKSLATYADLLVWGEQSGSLSAAAARRLADAAAERVADAEAAVVRAEERRALVERLLLALAENRHPAVADLEALNAALVPALSARRLVRTAGGYEWAWDDREDLDRVLWPALLSVADVLASVDLRRVRQCGAAGCRVLFVDRTSGSPRKWCSRETCGHRARALEYYHAKVRPRRKERRQRKIERARRELRRREESGAPEEPSS